MPRIFVQIASYRDPQLLPTLQDLDRNARCPQLLRFGICRQFHPCDRFNDLGGYADDARAGIIDVPYRLSRGACWARSLTQQLYAGEEYALQIDSHMRFAAGWDVLLVDMLRTLQSRCGISKPLLTAYLPMFNPASDHPRKRDDVPVQMIFSRFSENGILLNSGRAMPEWRKLRFPVRARFFSGHFAFAEGRFVREVPYDPNLYFHGEEISMAVRAYTHGYDLFHPHRSLLWHYYERRYRERHWDDHTSWYKSDLASHARVRALLGVSSGRRFDFVAHGLGRARSLRDYERFAGISFQKRTSLI
jgi:hypothetical protein